MAEARLPLTEWLFAGSPDDFMRRLGALPLAHQPGERWLYHMSGEILGVLVARASGKSFGAFLRERVLDPLGMKDTYFTVPEGKLDRLSTCYRSDPATGAPVVHDDARGGELAKAHAFESGAGGLASTVDDMLAVGRMMLGGGKHRGERVLSRTAVELMTTDQIAPEQKAASPFFPGFWDGFGWGLGLGVVTRRYNVGRGAGTFGWDGAFGSSWWIDPREGVVGVLMSQRNPDWMALMSGQSPMPSIVEDFWTAAYQAIDD
jgi:CubicO group peptidase (beta-lactamase class C family)